MSRVRRRSGNAVAEYLDLIGWKPSALYMVGVGLNHEEAYVLKERHPDILVYGWEPNPQTFQSIRDTFPGYVYESAVSDGGQTQLELHYSPSSKDTGTVLPAREGQRKSVIVQATSLDEMVWFEPNGLLWMDCEGSELDVIRGGEVFIGEAVKVINVELTGHPYGSGEGWPKPRDVDAVLRRLGFKQAWIHTIRTHRCQFDCVYVHESIYNPDLVCCF